MGRFGAGFNEAWCSAQGPGRAAPFALPGAKHRKADRPPEPVRGKPRRADARRPAPEGKTKTYQRSCKPGSVPFRAATIHLGCALPRTSSNQPARLGRIRPAGSPRRDAPIRSCSRWGLHCRACYQPRGALLPHHFDLAGNPFGSVRRCLFCCTVPGVAPGGRYPPPSIRGARTFLERPSPKKRAARGRPDLWHGPTCAGGRERSSCGHVTGGHRA